MWYQDFQEGEGTMYYYNGDLYVGMWHQDKRNGHGTYTWKGGAKYEGEWTNDLKNGKGVMTWEDGSKYEGEWKNGERTGKEHFITPMAINISEMGKRCTAWKRYLLFPKRRTL